MAFKRVPVYTALTVVMAAALSVSASAAEPSKILLIENFELQGLSVKDNTVLSPSGATIGSTWNGPNSTALITLEKIPGAEGSLAFKVEYDKQDWCGSQIAMTKDGTWKDPVGAGWDAIRFMFLGENSGNQIGVDIPDTGNEFHRYILTDEFDSWTVIEIPFSEFTHREDWQPEDQDDNNTIDWPFKELKWEPISGAQTFYIDKVELIKY